MRDKLQTFTGMYSSSNGLCSSSHQILSLYSFHKTFYLTHLKDSVPHYIAMILIIDLNFQLKLKLLLMKWLIQYYWFMQHMLVTGIPSDADITEDSVTHTSNCSISTISIIHKGRILLKCQTNTLFYGLVVFHTQGEAISTFFLRASSDSLSSYCGIKWKVQYQFVWEVSFQTTCTSNTTIIHFIRR